MKGLKLN